MAKQTITEIIPETILDDLTDTQRKIVLATLQGVEKIMEKREKQITKRWHNIFAWIASQFKT